MTPRPAGPVRRALAPLRRMPAAAFLCALVAFLNVTAWSLLTPPFQAPDEQSHYGYSEYLVTHGHPPIPADEDLYSDSQTAAMRALQFDLMQFEPDNVAIWSASEHAALERQLARHPGRAGGNGGALAVGGEPPLYYALEAVPYAVGADGTVLDRLALMRLLSALLGGVTVLFVFLFLREALPGSPWSWTVGALGVAFQPLFGFISGAVNSDALLYPASAAVFYLLARAFRRGLTPGLAAALGIVLAVGSLTKFNFLGLLPGVAVALLVLARRRTDGWSLRSLGPPVLALAIPLCAIGAEMALNAVVWDRPTVGASASAFSIEGLEPSIGGALSYIWQFYLVPLPGMTQHLGSFPLREEWLGGFVGRFGWVDTNFDPIVYDLAAIVLLAIAALAIRALVASRAVVLQRRAELLSYALIAVSFALFVAFASYIVYTRYEQSVSQTRYLFPLLPLYGAALALALRGVPRRWAPSLGTAIVLLAIAHSVFSQVLVVFRYYG